MKSKIAVLILASTMIAPSAALWASAGDANQPGANAAVTGTPAVKTTKKHHGHHHKKSTTANAPSAATPVTK